jgi:hypothetical protein
MGGSIVCCEIASGYLIVHRMHVYRYKYLVIYFFLIFIKYTRVPGAGTVAGTTFSLFTFPTTVVLLPSQY